MSKVFSQDTLTTSRFIEDSFGNGYVIEYHYANEGRMSIERRKDSSMYLTSHSHYISLVSIIAFRGNKTKIIASNIKSIYSPVECIADSRELWLKRLYQIQNGKNNNK